MKYVFISLLLPLYLAGCSDKSDSADKVYDKMTSSRLKDSDKKDAAQNSQQGDAQDKVFGNLDKSRLK